MAKFVAHLYICKSVLLYTYKGRQDINPLSQSIKLLIDHDLNCGVFLTRIAVRDDVFGQCSQNSLHSCTIQEYLNIRWSYPEEIQMLC